jgi:predicted nucleic acid-binding protein
VSESWVINASPVILLAKVGLMDSIPALAETFVIPQPVVDEISSVHNDAAALWLNGAGKQFVRPAVTELTGLAGSEIGAGERSVISWAVANPGFIAVLDDREARNIAQRLGVRILGTVGVVLRLKKAGLISEVKTHLTRIRTAGGYISDELFREALRTAGEQL